MNPQVRAVLVGLGFAFMGVAPVVAQDEALVLSGPSGVAATFSMGSTGWRLANLTTASSPEGGWQLTEEGVEIATADHAGVLNRGWALVEQQPDKLVLEQAGAETGLRVRRVFSFGPASNVMRIETWVQSPDEKRVLTRIGLLDLQAEGEVFRETG